MSQRAKDFIERLGFTLLFVAVGLAIPYFTGSSEAWAVPIVAGLQIVKNMLAQQVGDPESSGFTDITPPALLAPVAVNEVDDLEDSTGDLS